MNWYKKAQSYEDNVESVVFLDGSEADEPMRILDERGEQAAMEYLKQWHYPGEHMTRSGFGNGTSDEVYTEGPYQMSYNRGLGYIGLEAKLDDSPDDIMSGDSLDMGSLSEF